MSTANGGERKATFLTAPTGCHLHRGSGVLVTVGHTYDIQGLSEETYKALFYFSPHI